MDEHRYYCYGVRDEMYQLQLVVEEKTLKKSTAGMLNPRLKETKTTYSLSSSVGKASPVGAFHSTPLTP
jgi:hypothetical protein